MRNRRYILWYACDFETTRNTDDYTEVWSSAYVRRDSEDVHIDNNISDTFQYFVNLKKNVILYYHNLKFDGSFWLWFLKTKTKYKEARTNGKWLKTKEMPRSSYKYLISAMGEWYNIVIKTPYATIEIRDSYKLLPFALKSIGESFQTKHKKLTMEYRGYRYSGMEISESEKAYIRNDVLVLKEALEEMYRQGHNQLTIGACCMMDFRIDYPKKSFERLFPNLYEMELPNGISDKYTKSIGAYIKRSYYGGWVYCNDRIAEKWVWNGFTDDAYSLYPSVMHSQSGNRYPVGVPIFWKGKVPEEIKNDSTKYYFVHFRCRFQLKDGYLPFLQIKNSLLYKRTEMLKTSDIKINGKYYKSYSASDGTIMECRPELILTCTDYIRFLEHYTVYDIDYIDGCYFETLSGLFDNYLNRYNEIKMSATGARRTQAKLFLNNLYGKFATSTDSSYKLYNVQDGKPMYSVCLEDDKKPGYIPIGSAITSYARDCTIRAAQKNYHTDRGFCYADTDSIHANIPLEKVVGIPHAKNGFCTWKTECTWTSAKFLRSKTYLEIVDGVVNITCAGMPIRSKMLFLASCGYPYAIQWLEDSGQALTQAEKEYLQTFRTLDNFDFGMIVPGKLRPKQVPGGTVLIDTEFTMKRG